MIKKIMWRSQKFREPAYKPGNGTLVPTKAFRETKKILEENKLKKQSQFILYLGHSIINFNSIK